MVIGHTLRVNPQFSLIFRYFQHMVVQYLRSRNLDIGHTAQLPESPSNSTDRLWRLWMVMGQAVAVYQVGVANVAKLTICIHFSQHICVKFHWGISQFISNVTNLLIIWHYASQPISFMQSNIVRFLYQPQLAQEHPLPPAWWCPTADVTRSCKSCWRYKPRLHWSPGESQWQLRPVSGCFQSHEIRSTLW